MNKPFMWAYDDEYSRRAGANACVPHPADKFYLDGGGLYCTHCECAVVDHQPQPEYYQITLTMKVSSFSHANAAIRASSCDRQGFDASVEVLDNKTKFVVSHWEEFSSAESGPREPYQVGDYECETEAEALAWVAEQENPKQYAVEEVQDWEYSK